MRRYFLRKDETMYYIGVDLGTSAVKLLLMDGEGKIRNVVSREYPLRFPQPGWSEQDPQDWIRESFAGIRELTADIDRSQVAGIGCGGQMHGLVALDAEDRVIRPAILWNDGRTEEETAWLNTEIGKKRLSELTANIAFAGFTAPKLLWMKKHSCDYSDASGMLLLDVEHKRWSREMLEICGVEESWMPQLFESYDCVGTLKPAVASELGLPETVKVVAGAGDNAAAAVGTGVVGEGGCNISLGTSGTIFISSEKFGVDPNNALHSFAHADGGYHLMGCMLSAASCNKWFCEEILKTADYAAEQKDITEEKLGCNRVFFLPYLMGERSPINDVNARGTFTGLSMDSTRSDMMQAVLEGVAFAIRDSLEVARSLGLDLRKSRICGGGAKSPLWRTIMANVCNLELEQIESEEGPGYGGAMLAAVACGEFSSVKEAAEKLVHVTATVKPDPEISARYEAQYQKFRRIYPAMKELFPVLNA